jgi:hypothetical protein
MSTAVPEAPPTEQVYGIAKRISLELEKFPLHTHAAIINIVNTMCQHRKIVLEEPQRQEQERYEAIQRRAQADAFEAAQRAHAERDAKIAEQIKAADEPKPPRLSVVLDKPAPDSHLGAVEDATGCPSELADAIVKSTQKQAETA